VSEADIVLEIFLEVLLPDRGHPGPLMLFRTARVLARLMIMSARGRARSGRAWPW